MSELSTGAYVGIVIGVIVFLILLGLLCYYCKRNAIGLFRNRSDQERDGLVNAASRSRGKRVLLVKRCEQETTRDVENEIIRRSRVRENTWRPEIDDGQNPVLVFCVVSSRIGTDIEAAMRGVNSSSYVILVVLHSVHSSLLQGDLSDNEYLLDQRLKDKLAGRIAHFAFSENERLYRCPQNTEGFRKIDELTR